MSKLKEALQEVHRFFTPRIHEWEKGNLANPRLWTRIYYEGVGVIDSGWRTIDGQNYKDEKKKDENGKLMFTKDHFMMPQLFGQFLLDNWYLVEKEDDFVKWGLLASQVIYTTKEENVDLSKQSPKGGSGFYGLKTGETFLTYSIKDKYKVLGLKLWNEKDGHFNQDNEFPIEIPQEYLDYEKQYLKDV